MNQQKFNPCDKVRIIACPPRLGDIAGREVHVSTVHPLRSEHNFPFVTILLGAGETADISTVFLQMVKLYEEPLRKARQQPAPSTPAPVEVKPTKKGKTVEEKRAYWRLQAEKQRARKKQGKVQSVVTPSQPVEELAPAPRERQEIREVLSEPEVVIEAAPLAKPHTGVPTCRRCGFSSPMQMGVNRCEQVDSGGKRCGGAMVR